MSEGWIVKSSVVAVKSGLPDGVADACVSFLRVVNRFPQDVQCFDTGTVYYVGLSALASQRAEALSLFPGRTVTGKGLMFILVHFPGFGQWRGRGRRRRRWWGSGGMIVCCCRDWTGGLGGGGCVGNREEVSGHSPGP